MKKTLTPEETAARDARRAKFAALVKQVGAMDPAARAVMFAKVPAVLTVEGKALSPLNGYLCALQSAGNSLSIVGGFRQWLRAGRCVRKGSHGLTIWVPLGAKRNAEGEEGDGVRFGTGTVFDISQTVELASQEKPVAVVFGMAGLPNVVIDEEPAEAVA